MFRTDLLSIGVLILYSQQLIFVILVMLTPPRRYPYFDVVVGLVWSHDTKSYAGSSICFW
jgi:hypothetical protein